MKKIFLLSVSFFLFNNQSLFGQWDLPEYGVITEKDKELKECAFEKDAEAIVIFDAGISNYDDNYKLVTQRRIRIKILNERGLNQANIKIRFYSHEDYEFIRDISAITYTPAENGDYISYKVDRKSFYTEKEDNYYSVVKFAFPNVKVGSIIEYKYEKVTQNYGGLRRWEFQSDIPTIRSCYFLMMIPHAEFTYSVQKKRDYPIIVKPDSQPGQIYFEMDNIPGLKFEPYMDAVKDYLQRVEFQLSGVISVFGDKKKITDNWKDLANELGREKSLGSIKKNSLPVDELKLLVEKVTSASQKLAMIYNYVRKKFVWNGYYSKFADEGLKTAWEKKSGDAAEINLILLNLLQSFDIEAYPLLVAERDFGKVDTTYPFMDRFNKTAVYAIADNKEFILDATQTSCPPQLTSYSLLNTHAFIVDRKKYKLFRIKSSASYKNISTITATLSGKAILKGEAVILSNDYSKQFRSEEIKKDEKKFINKTFVEPYESVAVDSFYFENLNNDDEPLIQNINFTSKLNENGDYLLLNYNLFTGLEKNPFTKPERFTNVDFGFPYIQSIEEQIEFPVNAKIEDVPKNKRLITTSRDISVSRSIKLDENRLVIRIEFIQTATLIYPDNYETLKEFYQSMVTMLNEPVVIKLPK